VRDHEIAFRQLFRELIAVGERGFLLHCMSGTVFEDYLLTNKVLDLERRTRADGSAGEEAVRVLARVQRDYLQSAFDEMAMQYGGIDSHFRAIGVDDEMRTLLRRRLVDPV
jgi:protein tyrosine/serine phosphatase